MPIGDDPLESDDQWVDEPLPCHWSETPVRISDSGNGFGFKPTRILKPSDTEVHQYGTFRKRRRRKRSKDV